MNKPNFKKSIVNLSSTLSNFVGVKSDIPELENLKNVLSQISYENVIFVIFDGLGIYDIDELSTKSTFYKDHVVDTLTSTMPATTTNATTSMLACKYPSQHLWLAWSLYLKEQKRAVELYLSRDYYTHEKTEPYSPNTDITAFIDKANTNRELFVVVPEYCKNFKKTNVKNANTVDQFFEKLNEIAELDSQKFVYAYCDEPDHTMHEFGVHSQKTQDVFDKIEGKLKRFIESHKNTLIITTADHGHVDISEFVDIYADSEIMDLLARPLSGENRFASIKTKPNKQNEFEKVFNKKYGKDFELKRVDDLIKDNVFGTQENAETIKERFGDFVAIGNSNFKSLVFFKEQVLLKGNHAGGSKEEMEVPLCIFTSKDID